MWGWFKRARIEPSRRKRSSPARPTSDGVQELDCRLPLEAAVAAPGEPDAAHARPGRSARRACRRRSSARRAMPAPAAAERPLRESLPGESALRSSSSASRSAASAGSFARRRLKARRSLVFAHLQRLIEIGTDHLPAIPAQNGHVLRKPQAFRAGSCGGDRCALSPSAAARCAPRRRAGRRSPRRRSRRRTSGRRSRRATYRPRQARRAPSLISLSSLSSHGRVCHIANRRM